MKALVIAVAAVAVVTSCSKGDNNAADTVAGGSATGSAMGATTAAAPAPAPAQLNDASVLAKLSSGDSAEIALGKLVQTKATDAGVKQFGTMLVTDHGANAKQVASIAKKDSVTPQPPPNDTSAAEHQHVLDRFKSMAKGKDFDTAFVNHAVEDHSKEISELQSAQGSLQKPDVQALVTKTLPVMQKHLDRAKALQTKLGGAK
jgi:putative membrane protein